MPTFIKKNPNASTLIDIVLGQSCPSGYTPSTQEEADAWVAAQLAAGWTPASAPVVVEPKEISKLTLRRRLRAMGKEAAFDDLLDVTPNARRDWEDAQALRTDDPMFTTQAPAMKAALGLTDSQFSDLVS